MLCSCACLSFVNTIFCTQFLDEDVTIQDLETFKKVELDDIIKKFGPRRRFGRILIQWMLTRGLSIDPELLMVYTFIIL